MSVRALCGSLFGIVFTVGTYSELSYRQVLYTPQPIKIFKPWLSHRYGWSVTWTGGLYFPAKKPGQAASPKTLQMAVVAQAALSYL